MKLGENIYKHRTKHNMSQTALAEALGVSRQSISKWENDSAMPELDKLVKMSELFQITLDELVFDKKQVSDAPPQPITAIPLPPKRIIAGFLMLIFGMIFFLLSIFWGNHLYFGEEFGEFTSLVILLISVVLLATYNLKALTVCAIGYTIYSIIWYRFIEETSLLNYLFTFIVSIIIFIWFLILGSHKSKQNKNKNESKGDS